MPSKSIASIIADKPKLKTYKAIIPVDHLMGAVAIRAKVVAYNVEEAREILRLDGVYHSKMIIKEWASDDEEESEEESEERDADDVDDGKKQE